MTWLQKICWEWSQCRWTVCYTRFLISPKAAFHQYRTITFSRWCWTYCEHTSVERHWNLTWKINSLQMQPEIGCWRACSPRPCSCRKLAYSWNAKQTPPWTGKYYIIFASKKLINTIGTNYNTNESLPSRSHPLVTRRPLERRQNAALLSSRW